MLRILVGATCVAVLGFVSSSAVQEKVTPSPMADTRLCTDFYHIEAMSEIEWKTNALMCKDFYLPDVVAIVPPPAPLIGRTPT